MTDCSIDAIIIAKAIQKDDISFLRGKEFKMRDKMKKKKGPAHPGVKTVKKSRIDKLEGRMDRFESRMGRTEELIAKLIKKIDNLGNDLRNEMNAGFKQVNSRIDQIEARLDYNGLKKLPVDSK